MPEATFNLEERLAASRSVFTTAIYLLLHELSDEGVIAFQAVMERSTVGFSAAKSVSARRGIDDALGFLSDAVRTRLDDGGGASNP